MKRLFFDFVIRAETAENKSGWRQSARLAGDLAIINSRIRVRGLVAMRKPDDLFSIKPFVPGRDNDVVGDDIVHEPGAHCSWKSEIIHLDGGRPLRRDSDAVAVHPPNKVHEDIDAVGPDSFCSVFGGQPVQFHKTVDALFYPFLVVTLISGAQGVGNDADPAAVVTGEQSGREVCRGRVPKLFGKVADGDDSAIVLFDMSVD